MSESSPLPDRALDRMRARLGTPALVAGRYELRALLGRGGMGEVHRAYDHHLEREVAIKLLARDVSATSLADRLERESRVLARLEHPGIVPVYDAGMLDDGRVFYVMRLVDGVRLDAFVRSGVTRGALLRTLLRMAEAVAFAHERGIVHRDLKPGNVMIGPFGEVLVLDWGVAKVMRGEGEKAFTTAAQGPVEGTLQRGTEPDLTRDGVAVGTPGYMAPEQAAAGGVIDGRVDVFALGVILREMLDVHDERVPRPLAAVVAKATAPARDERYLGVTALADDVRRWLDGEAVSAHHEGPLERAARFVRKHQVAILLLLTYVIVRVLILVTRGI